MDHWLEHHKSALVFVLEQLERSLGKKSLRIGWWISRWLSQWIRGQIRWSHSKLVDVLGFWREDDWHNVGNLHTPPATVE